MWLIYSASLAERSQRVTPGLERRSCQNGPGAAACWHQAGGHHQGTVILLMLELKSIKPLNCSIFVATVVWNLRLSEGQWAFSLDRVGLDKCSILKNTIYGKCKLGRMFYHKLTKYDLIFIVKNLVNLLLTNDNICSYD